VLPSGCKIFSYNLLTNFIEQNGRKLVELFQEYIFMKQSLKTKQKSNIIGCLEEYLPKGKMVTLITGQHATPKRLISVGFIGCTEESLFLKWAWQH
jgi:hypothetical protein